MGVTRWPATLGDATPSDTTGNTTNNVGDTFLENQVLKH